MKTLPPTAPTELAIARSAVELVDRYGRDAVGEAAGRAAAFARDGRWPEHDLALRVLSAVEMLTGRRG